jgi:hypothetical protein
VFDFLRSVVHLLALIRLNVADDTCTFLRLALARRRRNTC